MMAGGMDRIHRDDLDAALDHWRARYPPSADGTLAPQVAALAEAVARLACQGRHEFDVAHLPDIALNAWLAWYASTPDAPCIAICSTAQGDAVCKGCGRTEHEVQHWPAMGPFAKRAVWYRITQEGTAWRFNRYAERAQAASPVSGRADTGRAT